MTRKERDEIDKAMHEATIELIHGANRVAIANATMQIARVVAFMQTSAEQAKRAHNHG